MSSIFLTMQAGGALDAALHLRGRAAHLIAEHSQAAHVLAFIYVVFTAVLIITYPRRSGVARPPHPEPIVAQLRGRRSLTPQSVAHAAVGRSEAVVDRRQTRP
jgi:hypothetical protein